MERAFIRGVWRPKEVRGYFVWPLGADGQAVHRHDRLAIGTGLTSIGIQESRGGGHGRLEAYQFSK